LGGDGDDALGSPVVGVSGERRAGELRRLEQKKKKKKKKNAPRAPQTGAH
jgi:hypothetical protein